MTEILRGISDTGRQEGRQTDSQPDIRKGRQTGRNTVRYKINQTDSRHKGKTG